MKTSDTHHTVYAALVAALAKASGLPDGDIAGQLGRPPKAGMGDYAFPCFAFAKQKKMAPPAAAAEVAQALNADASLAGMLEKAETAGAFLNVRIKPGALCQSVLKQVQERGEAYGESAGGAGRTIIIDFSAPNIAKPFHVGHLMSTIIGASLVRIYRAMGFTVVGVNHLGDWGVQCGFQFLAWQRADPQVREKQLAERGLDYLAELYIDINSAAKQVASLENQLASKEVVVSPDERARIKQQLETLKPEADARDAEARALFKKLEDGDAELKQLWERLRRETLVYLQRSYDRLGVKFDSDAGEGFYEPMLKPLLADLKAKGVAVESEGALVIPMDDTPPQDGKPGKPPFILLKSDEATIYGTRDLAAALYRQKTYGFHKNLYVVDVRQNGHFQMLFKAIAKMGLAWSKDCVHVSFGMMQIKEGETVMAMTTRGGSMIPLNELLDRMVATVKAIVLEKNPDLSADKADRVAEAVGVGAIVFWIQARRRTSNFVFDWRTATDPAGDTGPYLQYTHARACSILRKSQTPPERWLQSDCTLLSEPEAVAVAKALEQFPNVLRQAAENYEPSLLASYLLELASAFGNFLNKHRVIDSPEAARNARLALVDAVRRVMSKGLQLIGVAAPEEM